MYRRIKKTTKHLILMAFLVIFSLITVLFMAVFYIKRETKNVYEIKLHEKELIIDENCRTAYIATCDIRAGDVVDEAKVEKRLTFSAQENELLLSDKELGQQALIDIPKGTHLSKFMVTPMSDIRDLREMFFREIELAGNIESNDMVDVRIRFPNGEDYIVLARKRVCLLDNSDHGCYLKLDEEEILRMSAAILDVSAYNGARIYTSEYIIPTLQPESIVTYVPGEEVMDLILNNPNILQVSYSDTLANSRKDLDNRLKGNIERREQWYE